MKVLGYAPHGRSRYNIGFGSVGVIAPGTVVETNFLNSRSICAGPYGEGTDTKCELVIPTPIVPATGSYTVTATGYRASALSFDDLLTAKTESKSTSYIARLILGSLANANSGASRLVEDVSTIDGWFINERNQLSNQKIVYDEAEFDY